MFQFCSILTAATDANPVNKAVQFLLEFETKIQEAWRPNNFTNWCESQLSDLAFAVHTEQERSS